MRHDRRAENTDGDVECRGIEDNLWRGDEAAENTAKRRLSDHEFDEEANGDQPDQAKDERFDVAETAMLQEKHDDDIGRGDDRAEDDGNMEEQIKRNRRADDFGQVAGSNRNFAEYP